MSADVLSVPPSPATPMANAYTRGYQAMAYLGLMTVFGSILYGFRYAPAAPWSNYGWNVLLYAAFITPHLVMTRAWWKRLVASSPAGSPRERRAYILVTVVTWVGVMWLHRPVPGGSLPIPAPVVFCGTLLFLLAFLLFFQGVTVDRLNGLLGVPGSVSSYSHGPETPLFTDGPYGRVRHPMYRAAGLAAFASLLIHPNAGQLLWCALVTATFVAFIPIEEAQLLAARGDDYLRYKEQTPWRLIPGVW